MSILDQIVDRTRSELTRKKTSIRVADLKDRPLYDHERIPFARALQGGKPAFICELKKASPSKGVIRKDFDIERFAMAYQENGATALSVLTEPYFFQGSLEYLQRVRQIVTLPLLRKDFIIDPYQVIEARAYGADAILLIAATLNGSQLHELIAAAEEEELDCLVEVYDPAELDFIPMEKVKLLGVNNRNLHTFEVNLAHSIEVFTRVASPVIRISESGIRTPQDMRYLVDHGTDAVLIGETFMRAEDPGKALFELRRNFLSPSNLPNDEQDDGR